MTTYVIFVLLAAIWVFLYWVACKNYRDLRKVMIHHQRNHAAAVCENRLLRAENCQLGGTILRFGLQHELPTAYGSEKITANDRRSLARTMLPLPAGPRLASYLTAMAATWAGRFWEEMREFL